MKNKPSHHMKIKTTLSLMAIALSGCSTINPPPDTAAFNRINSELKNAATSTEKAAPLPEAVSASLLPPLRVPTAKASSKQLEQRFDLVVSDAPLSQVLAGIVSGTKYSILLKPKTVTVTATNANAADAAAKAALAANPPERVTLNLKNVTIFEALDAIREVYGYDYSLDGNRIYVQPPELQTRLYQVNYIAGQRRGVSDLQVIGGASSNSSSSSGTSGTTSTSSTGTSGNGTGSGFASIQASGLSTIAKADLWGEIEDAMRTTLGCQIPKAMPGRIGGTGGMGTTGTTGTSGTANSTSSTRADVSFQGDMPSGERIRGVDGCTDGRAMTINQMSGTILVRAMPKELRTVEKMLRAMQLNIERQVIIEAKIIDVELNSGAQQGINWAGFSQGLHRYSVGADTAGFSAAPQTNGTFGGTVNAGSLAAMLGTNMIGTAANTAFGNGLGMALQMRNFSALINFLQTQGNVQVLSSPRIATLNNQKAVIKVGSEEPYVTNINPGTTTAGTGGSASVVTPPTLNYQPFFSGIALDVTPQIDDKDNITLHVHSMVNSIVEKQKISQPAVNAAYVPFAVNTINEADSVVRTRDGQVVVIGGLMTESTRDNRNKVPGVGDVPAAGALFSKGEQSSRKRELVILLKPTVVKDDAAWSSDINATQERIEALSPTASR